MNSEQQIDELIQKSMTTGVLTERLRIMKLLEGYEHNEDPFCYRCDLADLITREKQ